MTLRHLLIAVLAIFSPFTSASARDEHPPNIVLIVADNLGYGDVGCFGSTVNDTPALDRMAAEGVKLTSFYSASSVCTPSRAAFMTGCYPQRVSMEMSGTRRVVLQPVAQKGLNPYESTIAEVLKEKDYSTHCIGKWHLGDQPQFLPTQQGFDGWLGVPYSEDMIATTAPRLGEMWPPLPLVRNNTVIDAPVDPNTLTEIYTEEAVDYIRKNRDRPFFFYLPHAVPGSSAEAFAGEKFRGKSRNGTYGDCVAELDWSTGEILRTLKEEGLDDKTLVIWTSDNGAFQGNRRVQPYGQNTPLRGTGGTPYEGGFRVPCIARWPGKIPAGTVCDELITSMDLLPTFAELAVIETPPSDRIIDGKDVWPLLAGKDGAKSPHDHFFYYRTGQLRAVRSGNWKLLLPVNLSAARPAATPRFQKLELYDLDNDLSETTNLADQHPDIVTKLSALADEARVTLGDLGRLGIEQRPAGWLDNTTALRLPGLPSVRGFLADAIPLLAPGTGMTSWQPGSAGWAETSAVALDVDNRKQINVAAIAPNRIEAEGGVLHNTDGDPTGKKGEPLFSRDEFGDVQLHVEFLVSEKSNSGVYLMGRYEIQIMDTHAIADADLKHGHSGGVYQRWDESRDPKGYEGTPPRTNAARPAGEWESFDIVFRAPRFDDDGNKTADATFVSVHHNGVLVHENVTCSGPTRGAKVEGEAATGPIMIQGDHGPVALRNIWVRPLD